MEKMCFMPLPREQDTSKDYWSLPEGAWAELIDGQFYNMAPPSRIHQKLSDFGQLVAQNHYEQPRIL